MPTKGKTMATRRRLNYRIEGTTAAAKAFVKQYPSAYFVSATSCLGARRIAAKRSGLKAAEFVVVWSGKN